MLERQLASLYSALDKAPNAKIVLRVRHADGFKWSVCRRVMSVGTEAGASFGTIDLETLTVAQLADWFEAHGFDVIYQNTDMAHRIAATILSGKGQQSQSNGDALSAYDSLLWSVLDAYSIELEEAEANIDKAILQLYLGSAEGEWLDLWGEFFGLPRDGGVEDSIYRQYLIDETLRPRSNAIAIEKAVKELTGKKVEIYEPWKDLHILGESKMDDRFHMQDGNYWTFSILQPISRTPIDWTNPLAVIDRNRAGGNIIAPPKIIFDPREVKVGGGSASASQHSLRATRVKMPLDVLLDTDKLSEAQMILNHLCVMYQTMTYGNDGVQEVQTFGKPRQFAKASITLSDGVALGDINGVMAMKWEGVEFSNPETLSEFALSGIVASPYQTPIDEVTEFARRWANAVGADPAVLTGKVATRGAGLRVYDLTAYGWQGGDWDGRRWETALIQTWREQLRGAALASDIEPTAIAYESPVRAATADATDYDLDAFNCWESLRSSAVDMHPNSLTGWGGGWGTDTAWSKDISGMVITHSPS